MFYYIFFFLLIFTFSIKSHATPYANWKFEEGDGIISHDSIGNNNGTLYGDTCWEKGDTSCVLSFDGDGDYVQIGATNSPSLIPEGSNFTISAWVNTKSVTSGRQAIYGCYSSYTGAYLAYSLELNNGDFTFILGNGTNVQIFSDLDSGNNLTTDTWYFLTVAFDGTNIKSYINGQFKKQVEVSLNDVFPQAGSGDIYELIGGTYAGLHCNFNGKIDDVRVWRRTLCDIEIENVFNDINTTGLYFDGIDDYVVCTNESNFDFGNNDFTISAWFKIDNNSINSDRTIAGKSLGQQAGGNYNGYRLSYYWGNVLTFTVNNGYATYSVTGTKTLEKERWYHVAAMRNGRKLRIYLDGNIYAETEDILPEENFDIDNNYPFAIGASVYWDSSHFFYGNIDAVAVFNKALNQKEIFENINFSPAENLNLVAYYSFDDKSLDDYSELNNYGISYGNPLFDEGVNWSGDNKFDNIWSNISNFNITVLPISGNVTLDKNSSLTSADLENITIDDTDLTIGAHAPYLESMSDGLQPGTGPYVAKNIKPFRFKYFLNEFIYNGHHNFEMLEYASNHGFNCIHTYNSSASEWSHLPNGTILGSNGGFKNIDLLEVEDRFDLVASRESICADHLENNKFPFESGHDIYMIDLEDPSIPSDSEDILEGISQEEYYNGFINCELAAVDAAHLQGWNNVGIYGWQPWTRSWDILGVNENLIMERWENYGKEIAAEVDILYPSVYSFYWDQKNLAYVLHNIDKNIEYSNRLDLSKRKPMRPYYWNLLHGGGEGWRWWEQQPLKNEDFRAMGMMNFFTGTTGLVHWSWSGFLNHHDPGEDIIPGNTVMVDQEFICFDDSSEPDETTFKRYDALYIESVNGDNVSFKLIDKDQATYGSDTFTMPKSELIQYLRAKSQPVSAMIEGLALVKLFEYIISHGKICIDVPAAEQFSQSLPIVRRIKFGPYHIVATYDPFWEDYPDGRIITLNDFSGKIGLNIHVPADKESRIFVVCE
jgi:hypothetical protein